MSLYDVRQTNGLEYEDRSTYKPVTRDYTELEGSCDFDLERKTEDNHLTIQVEDRDRAIVDMNAMKGLLISIEGWLKDEASVVDPDQC